jgi:hypothetical protein
MILSYNCSENLPLKYVTVNIYLFEGSDFSYHDSQFIFAQEVYKQANIKLILGKVVNINVKNSDSILGCDFLLEILENNGLELLAVDRVSHSSKSDINAYYVVALTEHGHLDITTSGIRISQNTIVMTAASDGRTLAHEIGHSLLGPGHEVPDSTYLMYYKNFGGTKLSPKEIEKIRLSKLLRNIYR